MLRRVHQASSPASNGAQQHPSPEPDAGHLYRARLLQSDHRAVLGFTDNGIIEFTNDAAAKMFGRHTGELIGRSIETMLPRTLERLMTSPAHRLWSVALRNDGTSFPVRVIV